MAGHMQKWALRTVPKITTWLSTNMPTIYTRAAPVFVWYRNFVGYRRYGLHFDDLIIEDIPGVREAISRLPADVIDERNWRLRVALDLSTKGAILPRDQWPTDKEDLPYLQDVLQRVYDEADQEKAYSGATPRPLN